ncbi:hypothetical protein D3C72_2098880 [compost metagenome]
MGRAIATVIGVGEIIGGFVSPSVVGLSADTFGATAPFAIAAGAACIALVASVFLRETAPGKIHSTLASAGLAEELR